MYHLDAVFVPRNIFPLHDLLVTTRHPCVRCGMFFFYTPYKKGINFEVVEISGLTF